LLTGLVFLAAALLAWGAIPSGEGANGAPGHRRRWWQVLVVLLALSCIWELLGLEHWLGAQARAIARARDSYYLRAVLQKTLISGAVAAATILILLLLRGSGFRRLLLVSFALYLAISLVNLVSWHVIDKVAGVSWYGLTLAQALKLGCATAVLLGVRKGAPGHLDTGS
jgi:predicted secreted protein